MNLTSIKPLPRHPRLIFMGTPDFALPALEALIGSGRTLLTVVTQPDRPKGRGKKKTPPPVKASAVRNGIEVLQPENVTDSSFIAMIREKEPDLIIVVAFGQILKKALLQIPTWGVVNIHSSLLPKYRGAAPIQWAIMNRESVTGLTIMRMDEGLDSGPILCQEEIPIREGETAGQLHDRLAGRSGPLILQVLDQMAEKAITERPQDHARATYAQKIEKHMGLLDWHRPAGEIDARIRAMDPTPGAFTRWQGKIIKLFSSRLVNAHPEGGTPGRVLRPESGRLQVETERGLIEIGDIQFPGKKRMSVPEFLRGFTLPEGAILGS